MKAFNAKAHEVRALLDTGFVQVRRVVKPQPAVNQGMVNAAYCGHRNLWLRDGPCDSSDPAKEWRCPHGQLGSQFWVQETFCHQWEDETGFQENKFWYRASTPNVEHVDGGEKSPWLNSTQMPRIANRLTVENCGVRVEQVDGGAWEWVIDLRVAA